jgi:hypothetical protein
MKADDLSLNVVGLHKKFPGIVFRVKILANWQTLASHAEIGTPGNF